MNIIDSVQWKSVTRRMVGIMTGTSLDGIDICVADFNIHNSICFQVVAFGTYEFPIGLKEKVLLLLSEPNLDDLSQINFLLPKLYYDAIRGLCVKNSIDFESIDAISIHGQTIWHHPIPEDLFGYQTASSLQIANPSVLSKISKKPVISDFRSADIALGGQGAPLIPAFDFDFLRSETENIVSLNIGGISNITLLKAGCAKSDVIAFDTGTGNILIDIISQKDFNTDYDFNGEFAKKGNIHIDLLNDLLSDDYFKKAPPKSSGREYFNNAFIDKYASNYLIDSFDLIATLTAFTHKSIAAQILQYGFEPDKLIISGGGALNPVIYDGLVSELPNTNILKSNDVGIDSDSKEALAFAYFGYRTLCGLPSNMPSVTGASEETILGSISF